MRKKWTLPKEWHLDKTDNPYEMEIIYKWMLTQPNGDHWELEYASEYHLYWKDYGKDPVGPEAVGKIC